MSENKTGSKTPKEFFDSFSEGSENALYLVDYTTKFKKSISLCYRRGLDLELLEKAIKILSQKGILPDFIFPIR
ncbi:hypothetical protein FACS189451_06300 [Bacteroidia bacterium]|nr:hypothetical protein FACS189451_06300 [Bacteroidia bacterium]